MFGARVWARKTKLAEVRNEILALDGSEAWHSSHFADGQADSVEKRNWQVASNA
jgi:hypothetical protein